MSLSSLPRRSLCSQQPSQPGRDTMLTQSHHGPTWGGPRAACQPPGREPWPHGVSRPSAFQAKAPMGPGSGRCGPGGGHLGELRNPPPAVAKAGPLVASTPSAPGSGLIKVRAILGSTPAQHTHYFVCSLRVVAQPLRLVELGTDALHLAQQTQLKWPGPTTERSSKSAKAF